MLRITTPPEGKNYTPESPDKKPLAENTDVKMIKMQRASLLFVLDICNFAPKY